MNKISKTIILSLAGVLTVGCLIGNTFANFIVKDNAEKFGVKIIPDESIKHTITYYLPDSTDTNHTNFVSSSITVSDNTNLYSALSSLTNDISGYSFASWHQTRLNFRNDSANPDIYPDTTTVTTDMTVYAKYVKSNVLFYHHTVDDVDKYVEASHNDYELYAKTINIGDWIYSYTDIEGDEINLLSDSGTYNLTKNTSDWSIQRKIKFGITDVSSWWFNDGRSCHIYMESTLDSSSVWLKNISFSDNIYSTYLDYKYNKFVVCRSRSATSTDWDQFDNQTIDTFLDTKSTGSAVYSPSHLTLYVQNNTSYVDGKNKQNINWW